MVKIPYLNEIPNVIYP